MSCVEILYRHLPFEALKTYIKEVVALIFGKNFEKILSFANVPVVAHASGVVEVNQPKEHLAMTDAAALERRKIAQGKHKSKKKSTKIRKTYTTVDER